MIRNRDEVTQAWEKLGDAPLIAEAWVDFDYEVSAIGARNTSGDTVMYTLTRNEHADGILRESRAPEDAAGLEAMAEGYMTAMLSHLDYVGVLALELFVCGDRLLANEFAPRVHNSGHWTIEGAETSQFSNHMRAVAGRDLGSTACVGHAGMENLIGTIPDAVRALPASDYHLHDYGKAPRPGRKLGHVTVVGETPADRDEKLRAVASAIGKV